MEGVLVHRGPRVESAHRVHVAVADATGTLAAAFGDPAFLTFLRSTAKPFQAMPLLEDGGADKFGLTDAQLAVTAASHSGQREHVEAVESILGRIGLEPTALRCGPHAPFHEPSARSLAGSFTALHNNCSGKHAGMLALCRHHGWPTENYLEFEHPCQQRVLRTLASILDLPPEVPRAVDGCGVPTYAVPMRSLAAGFARLADPARLPAASRTAAERISRAMRENPFLVGGEGRFDTDLMRATGGRLLAKVGGEGIHAVAVPARRLGLAVKVEDGASRAVGPAVVHALRQLDALTEPEAAALATHAGPELKNHAGRVVGRIEARFTLRW